MFATVRPNWRRLKFFWDFKLGIKTLNTFSHNYQNYISFHFYKNQRAKLLSYAIGNFEFLFFEDFNLKSLKLLSWKSAYAFKIFVSFCYNYNLALKQRPFPLSGFLINLPKDPLLPQVLLLNFRRNRFFPSLKVFNGETYLTLSLGLFSSFFHKGKFFIKNKAVYLVVASFLKKILMYASLTNLILFVQKIPLYLQEILSTLNNPVVSLYKHPFGDEIIDENNFRNEFYFDYFFFLNNKSYGFMKTRKRGRVKRKILKRIVAVNRLTD